jgi:hypothetical protein
MPKGFAKFREAAADIEARRQGGGGPWTQWFRMKDGESATVRFLEQGDDVTWAWFHQLAPKEGQNFGDDEPCRNQDGSDRDSCPGCQQGLRRKVVGFINIIWRDGPVWKTNEEGRLVKEGNQLVLDHREDILATWRGGFQVFTELDGIDAAFKGLMSRDFVVTRKGEQLNTTWQIFPSDPDGGPKAMSKADKELAAGKEDLVPRITPAEYEDWGKGTPAQRPPDGNGQVDEADEINPFRKKRDDA